MFCLTSKLHVWFFVNTDPHVGWTIRQTETWPRMSNNRWVGVVIPQAESNVILRNAALSINTSLPVTSDLTLVSPSLTFKNSFMCSCNIFERVHTAVTAVRTGDLTRAGSPSHLTFKALVWKFCDVEVELTETRCRRKQNRVHTPPSVCSFQTQHFVLVKTCHLLPIMHQTTQLRDAEWATSCSLYLFFFYQRLQ